MACASTCWNPRHIVVLVLYVLLSIILGTIIC